MPRPNQDSSEFVVIITGLPHSLAGPNSWKPVKDLIRKQILGAKPGKDPEPGKVNIRREWSPTESRIAICTLKTAEHARLAYERLANYVWDDGSVLATSLWRADKCIEDSRNGTGHRQPSLIQGAYMRGGRPLPGAPFCATAQNVAARMDGHASRYQADGSFDQMAWNPNAIAHPFRHLQPSIPGVNITPGASFSEHPIATVPDVVLYPDHAHQQHQHFAEMVFRQFQPGQVAQFWQQPNVPERPYLVPLVPARLPDHNIAPGRERYPTVTSSILPPYADSSLNQPISRGLTSGGDQRPRNSDRRTVIVHNLAYEASQNDVELHLGCIGRVQDCKIQKKDGENSKRRYALATFPTHEEAIAAAERLNGTRLMGREIDLRLWKEESSAYEFDSRVTATSARNSHPVIADGSVDSDSSSPI